MFHRVIARLDIKGPDLVKGIQLEGLRVMGSPADFARHYYKSGADELIYMDVVASLYQRNSLKELIQTTAKEVFIPLAVGGGLRSIDDIRSILRCGADKVVLNTAAIANPELISQAAKIFGSSTIVVAIEAIPEGNGQYFAYTDNGRNATGIEVCAWAQKVEELGAGEIFLTSVVNEGTGKGFDINLISKISGLVGIPVIAHGGCGRKEDCVSAIKQGGADAIALASVLHYKALINGISTDTSRLEGNTTFLGKGLGSKFNGFTIQEVKQQLINNQIKCRL